MPLALVSVHDKAGLAPFARRLAALGWSFLASGGSAAALRAAGLEVTEVADHTGSPEALGGRVKTLHPKIHGAILARSEEADLAELASRAWPPIDLVVVNLYPFEATAARPGATEAEITEEIDIGGVALIRAAAKNRERVCLLCDHDNYDEVALELEGGGISAATRARLARKGFAMTAAYDAAIGAWMEALDSAGAKASLPGLLERELRYGENPHQRASFRSALRDGEGRPLGPLGGRVLGGKELSYNNILDLDSAWRAVSVFEGRACAIVKHLSPCGMARAPDPAGAWEAALACDPVSAFGGVVAFNSRVDGATARRMAELFLECVVAPAFDAEALELLAKKKNLRLVEADPVLLGAPSTELRSVTGGWLVQDRDRGDPPGTEWKTVSKRAPSAGELEALRFAWLSVREVRSNAIVLAKADATVGIGGGQTNRVDAVRQALERAGERAKASVMASDAYFPFPDGVEAAGTAGVTALVHPGGSIRDAEVLAAADRLGLAVVTTGIRHFRH